MKPNVRSGAALAAAGLLLCLSARAMSGEPARKEPPARPRFVIALGEKATDPEKYAAEFLAERLRRDLGAEAAVGASAPAAGDAAAIIMGTPDSNPALAKFKADLPVLPGQKDQPNPEGFLITTDGGATVLAGASPRAVVYAAARLLRERGWRFCSLHDLGEVPMDAKTAWPREPIKDAPVHAIRALVTDSLGAVAPRYLDWMAANGLNRLVVRVDRAGIGSTSAAAREVLRRGLELELTAPDAWWRAQAGLKGDEKPEEAAVKVAEARKKTTEKLPGVQASALEQSIASSAIKCLGTPFSGPRGPLGDIQAFQFLASDRPAYISMDCSPRRFFLDEFSIAADYFALSAWKGPQPVEGFVRDYCRLYYGGGEAGDEIAGYFLGLEAMDAELASPDPLASDTTCGKWKALADRFRAARTKSPANTPPRKRIALHHRAVLDHYQSVAGAARLAKRAGAAADPREKHGLLLEVIKLAWDYNRRKEPRLFDLDPDDAYGFRDGAGRQPELEGELEALSAARTALLALDGAAPAGLVAAALAREGGGKVAAEPLAPEVGGNLAGSFADGQPGTATVLSAGPGGRFAVDFGKELAVGRVRFLGTSERPITQYRLLAFDASGTATTLAEGSVRAPDMFRTLDVAFPPARARRLVLEVERYETARQDSFGPGLAELEAYEK